MKNARSIRTIILFLSLIALSNTLSSQSVKVYGVITNVLNNEPIPFANIIIEGTSIGTISDINGNYEILKLPAGSYNFKCSYIGYDTNIKSWLSSIFRQ